MADELPPVVAKFIADVTEWMAPIDDAIKRLTDFQTAVNRAAEDTRSFGDKSVAATTMVRQGMDAATKAAQAQADAQDKLAAATEAEVKAAQRQRDASLEDTVALKAVTDAARGDAEAQAAAAAATNAQADAAQRSAEVDAVVAAMKKLSNAVHSVGIESHKTGQQLGFLKTHFSLMGGMFGTLPILGTIKGLEIVIHGAIEFLAVLIPALVTATIGIGGWAAASVQSFLKVYHQMMNLNTVSTALNQTIAPLGGSFSQLEAAVRPQVFELLGMFFGNANKSGSALNNLIMMIGQHIDHLMAVFETSKGGGGLADFFKSGAEDAKLFLQILGNIGIVVLKLTAAATKTHIAETLLSIIAAASRLLDVITKIPTPILTILIGLHGFVIWGGLAFTAFKNMTIGLVGILSKVGPLNNSMVNLAKGLGASTDAITKMGNASPAIKALADDIAAGDAPALKMAEAYGVSEQNLSKIVAKTPAVEAAAKAVGAGAQDVANFATAAAKSGVSMEELAAKSAGGVQELAQMTAGMSKGEQAAANLAVAFTGTGKAAVGAAEAATAAAAAIEADSAVTMTFGMRLKALGSALPGGPVTWMLALAAAAAFVGYKLASMPDTTQKWIDSLNQSVTSADDVSILSKTVSALAANTNELAYSQKTATGNATELSNNQRQLTTQLSTELQHVGQLQKMYGISLPQALALAQTAGVKATDLANAQGKAWAVDLTMVQGLTNGYKIMGQQAGVIGSDMNALTVAQSQQVSAMNQLNQAYDSFTKTVSGPIDSFQTLYTSIGTFNADAQAAGATMNGLGTSIISGGKAAAAAAPSFSNTAMQLQQQFQSVYGNVQQLFDAFRSSQALAGGGGDFTKFVKDAVASLIPLAGSSKAAAAEVSTLAQEAGGPATTSVAALAHWAGNVKNPLQAMYDASNKAAIGASNLNQDAAALTNTLQSDMSGALAEATKNAMGGQKALDTFATDLNKLGPASQQTIQAGRAVAQMFLSIDGNTQSAKAQFVGWMESMHMTAQQANALWSTVSKGVKPLASVRDHLASTTQAVQNLGKPGLWGQIEHGFMAVFNNKIGKGVGIAGLVLMLGGLKQIRDSMIIVKDLSMTMWGGLTALPGKIMDVVTAIKSWAIWENVAAMATKVWTGIQIAFDAVMDANPIAIIILAIIALVAAVIYCYTHFKVFRDVVNDIFKFVKTHWKLILIALVAPIALAIYFIIKYWHTIQKFFMSIISDILSWVKSHWILILAIMTGPVSLGLYMLIKYWHDIEHWFLWGVNRVIAICKGMLSLLLGQFKGVGTLLYDAGKWLVQGFINGITSMFSAVAGAAWNLIQSLGGPVKKLLGLGSPSKLAHYWGAMTGEGLVQGMLGHLSAVQGAAHQMAQRVGIGLSTVSNRGIPLGVVGGGAAVGGFGAASGNIIVQVDGKALFQIQKSQLYKYNIRNSGQVTGVLKPV